jgi:hypothetical protein
VDEPPVAETLPGLYREVLDAVAALEQGGGRREADRVRAEATGAYSKAWNQLAARRLRRLRDDALRVAGRHGGPSRVRPLATGRRRSIEGRPA